MIRSESVQGIFLQIKSADVKYIRAFFPWRIAFLQVDSTNEDLIARIVPQRKIEELLEKHAK
jgi:hypothetical protein